MYIATPRIVDDYIRHIPFGVHTSLQKMRKDLAAQHHAAWCCPITSGIFLRIVAEAAWEEDEAGSPLAGITPFWRMIDHHAPAARKVSLGAGYIRKQREHEGLSW